MSPSGDRRGKPSGGVFGGNGEPLCSANPSNILTRNRNTSRDSAEENLYLLLPFFRPPTLPPLLSTLPALSPYAEWAPREVCGAGGSLALDTSPPWSMFREVAGSC